MVQTPPRMLLHPGVVVVVVVVVGVGVDGGDEDEAKGVEMAVAVAAGLPELQEEQMVCATAQK